MVASRSDPVIWVTGIVDAILAWLRVVVVGIGSVEVEKEGEKRERELNILKIPSRGISSMRKHTIHLFVLLVGHLKVSALAHRQKRF
jgi:hypothetical protein